MVFNLNKSVIILMKPDHKTKLFAGLIISVAIFLAITSSWNDSLVVDEIPHIGAGYSYLVKQDMRLNPEHPPLAKDLAAIPLLFLKLKQGVFDTKSWQSDLNGQWEFGRKLIFNSGNDANQITHLVKLPMLLFFVLSAILIFRWAKKLYGNKAGLIALILFSFSPTVLAHSRFVTTDLPALFGILYATYFFFRYLKNQTAKNFWLASIFLGIALLTKFSTFMLIPFFFGLTLIYTLVFKKDYLKLPARSMLLAVTAFIIVVMPAYAFHTWSYPPERQHSDTSKILETFGNRLLADPIVWASDKPVLRVAAQYGLGLLMVTQRSVGGNTTYFLGEVSRFGWRHYFPIVYLIKEPLAWWALVVTALATAAVSIKSFQPRVYKIRSYLQENFIELAMILWLVFYWALSINSTLNIGVRHLLPTYPFAILLVSGQIAKINYKKFKIYGFLLTVLLGWYVFENLSVSPYYLTYFNQAVGGPSGGYRYVVDSNLDWGQDLKRFSNWVKENDIPKIEFDYFGWADPSYYLGERYAWTSSTKYKDAEDFKLSNQSDGWLAVSVSFLQGSQGLPDQYKSNNYLWLQNHTPVTTIGNSIFVYRIK